MYFDFYSLQSSAFGQVFLPFLLIFTLSYILFTQVKPFGEKKDNFNLIISIIIGIFAGIYQPLSDFLWSGLPFFIALVIIYFLIVLLLAVMKGIGEKDWPPILVMLVSIILLLGAVGVGEIEKYFGVGSENLLWAFGLVVFAFILYGAYKSGSGETDTTGTTSGQGAHK